MLTREDNELLTNVEKGSPMGEVFRRFWIPALLAEELAGPDCAPVEITLLGEHLVAFRDTDGKVGLMDKYCPHRGAPLFYGRNEECGLRCVYHGWKFDVDGNCTDIPNAPEGDSFKDKIHITAYPCVEAGSLIWTYMGPAESKPPFPEFEWCKTPDDQRYVSKFLMECNYLQAMEGDYDPGHGPFLHTVLDGGMIQGPQFDVQGQISVGGLPPRTRVTPADEPFPKAVGSRRQTESDKDSWGTVEDSDSGLLFVSKFEREDGTKVASVSPWMLPIFPTAGTTAGPNTYSTNIRVPIDNHRLMFYRMRWSYDPIPKAEIETYKTDGWYFPELIPGTFQPVKNIHNHYQIDRNMQKYFNYSGLSCFPLQDISMMEDQWGSLADRTQEHLTSSDFMIIAVRRRLLKVVRAMAEGTEPEEPWRPHAYAYHSGRSVKQDGTVEEAVAEAKAMALKKNIAGSVAV